MWVRFKAKGEWCWENQTKDFSPMKGLFYHLNYKSGLDLALLYIDILILSHVRAHTHTYIYCQDKFYITPGLAFGKGLEFDSPSLNIDVGTKKMVIKFILEEKLVEMALLPSRDD